MSQTTRLLQEVIKLLNEVIRINTTTAPLMSLQDTQGKVSVVPKVQPVVMYDTTDGKYKNFGTWSQPQTFNAGLIIPFGQKLYFGTDLDSYIWEDPTADIIRFIAGGNTILSVEKTSGYNFYADCRLRGYPLYIDASALTRIVTNGSKDISLRQGSIDALRCLDTHGLIYDYHQHIMEQTGAPTALGGYGALWTQNNNNLYFRDGDGVTHQVAFV